jgi:hypothetical protein
MYDLVAPVERVTGYDTPIPLFRLEMKYLPSVEKIVAAAGSPAARLPQPVSGARAFPARRVDRGRAT